MDFVHNCGLEGKEIEIDGKVWVIGKWLSGQSSQPADEDYDDHAVSSQIFACTPKDGNKPGNGEPTAIEIIMQFSFSQYTIPQKCLLWS